MSYLPEVAWSTIASNVSLGLTTYRYYITVNPLDPNEAGASTMSMAINDWFIDFAGYPFLIEEINGSILTVYDILERGNGTTSAYGPYANKLGYVYRPLNGAIILTQAQLRKLDQSASDIINPIEKGVAWSYRGLKFNDGTATKENTTEVILEDFTITDNSQAGWQGGNEITISSNSRNSIVGEPTGFPNRTDSSITQLVSSNREFTITGTNFKVYYSGKEFTKNTETVTLPNTTAFYFIYYNSSGVLTVSTTVWDFSAAIPIATVYYNSSKSEGIVSDERHGLTMDWATHAYLHSTVGTRYQSGFGASFDNTTFSIDSGIIWDEDIKHAISSQTQTRVFYRVGSNWTWTTKGTIYYYTSGGNIHYDNAGVLTPATSNQYVAYWVFATGDPETPIITIMGQRQDVLLSNARLNNTYESLSFTNLPFPEFKILYRVILRNDTTPYEEIQDLRSISNIPSGTYVATDHNVLTNRSALNSHPASAISTDTTNFNGILSATEDTVQKALDKIDDYVSTSSNVGFLKFTYFV